MSNVKLICKYRSQLMGVAILWVMLFHSEINFENQMLYFIKLIGYGGVDIFLFLSGIGLYCSLEKNEDILQFYKRRMYRLAPSYLPFLFIWFLITINWESVSVQIVIQEFLGNVFMAGWLVGLQHQFNWYIQTVFWFYFFTPIVYICVKRYKNDFIIMFFLCIFSIPFFGKTTLMAVTRLPVFVLGMMRVDHEVFYLEKANRYIVLMEKYVLALFGVGILAFIVYRREEYLWEYGMWWYPFILIIPGLCIFFSRIFERIERIKIFIFILHLLERIGRSSFEIYLLHIAIFQSIKEMMWKENNWMWFMVILIAIALGITYYELINIVQKYIFKKEYSNR